MYNWYRLARAMRTRPRWQLLLRRMNAEQFGRLLVSMRMDQLRMAQRDLEDMLAEVEQNVAILDQDLRAELEDGLRELRATPRVRALNGPRATGYDTSEADDASDVTVRNVRRVR